MKKHLKKNFKDMKDDSTDKKANEICSTYLNENKNKASSEKEDFEKALDREFLNLYIDWKNMDNNS
jgi:hypothetical protein